MARKFTMITPRIWHSEHFRKLATDEQRYLFLALLTGQHNNCAGAFRLPDAYIANDIGWTLDKLATNRDALIAGEMIRYDADTQEMAIARFIKNCPPSNPKHRRGILASIDELESDTIKAFALSELESVSPTALEGESAANITPISSGLANTAMMRRARG